MCSYVTIKHVTTTGCVGMLETLSGKPRLTEALYLAPLGNSNMMDIMIAVSKLYACSAWLPLLAPERHTHKMMSETDLH